MSMWRYNSFYQTQINKIEKMKITFVMILFSLFIVAGNVAAFDFNCEWEGYMKCSNDLADEPPIYFKGEISKKGTFFTTINITPTPGEKCNGVIDGKKISISCENGTFGYGEIKGRTIYITNHKPPNTAICKITATLVN
jgi:hypothetical protein